MIFEVPMPRNELLLKNQLCHPLYSASNALQRVYKRILDPIGITYPQYLILMALWERDGVNIQVIGEGTYFDSGTLTPLLQKLKKKGLIEITPLAEDRRNKLVFLTKKGRKLEERAAMIPETLACAVALPRAQLAAFKQLVEGLHQAIVAYESNQT